MFQRKETNAKAQSQKWLRICATYETKNLAYVNKCKGDYGMEADLILYSDAIFDSVKDEPFAGGIAIKGKKIIAVGSKEEIKQYDVDPDYSIQVFWKCLSGSTSVYWAL